MGGHVCTRVTKLREYADKITQEEVEWLAADPQIGEAIANMRALARELNLLAAALTEQVSAKGMKEAVEKLKQEMMEESRDETRNAQAVISETIGDGNVETVRE
jgi:hypothetical protein